MDVRWFPCRAIVAGISVSEMGDGGSLELSTLIMLGVVIVWRANGLPYCHHPSHPFIGSLHLSP